jgi:hypothetical protein
MKYLVNLPASIDNPVMTILALKSPREHIQKVLQPIAGIYRRREICKNPEDIRK